MASSGFFSDSVIHSVLKDSKLLSAFYHFNNKYICSTTFPPFIKYVKLPIGAFLKQLCFSTVLTEQSFQLYPEESTMLFISIHLIFHALTSIIIGLHAHSHRKKVIFDFNHVGDFVGF